MHRFADLSVLAACFLTGLVLSNLTLKQHADAEVPVRVSEQHKLVEAGMPVISVEASCNDCDPANCLACNVASEVQN